MNINKSFIEDKKNSDFEPERFNLKSSIFNNKNYSFENENSNNYNNPKDKDVKIYVEIENEIYSKSKIFLIKNRKGKNFRK